MKRAIQSSESIELGILLSLAGGFMDAYSYIMRGGVFANAQTGNILLLGVRISEGDFANIPRYMFPIIFFTGGIALARLLRDPEKRTLHWRQLTVLAEIVIFSAVAFMPLDMNLFANSLTSFACGLQVESFRKIHGRSAATTMCIGNLRSATENLCDWIKTRNRDSLFSGLFYYGVIALFIAGAVIGNLCIKAFSEKAILVCAAFLFAAFLMMFSDREKETNPPYKPL